MITVDNERGRNSIPKMFEDTGVQLHLTPGLEMPVLMSDMGPDRKDPKDIFVTAWEDGCIAKVKELSPDIVVSDMLGRPGFKAAD